MFAGPELMFDEVVPGSAHLLGLSQTPGIQRQEYLESILWLRSGWDQTVMVVQTWLRMCSTWSSNSRVITSLSSRPVSSVLFFISLSAPDHFTILVFSRGSQLGLRRFEVTERTEVHLL